MSDVDSINHERFVLQTIDLFAKARHTQSQHAHLVHDLRQTAHLYNGMSHTAKRPLSLLLSEPTIFVNGEVLRACKSTWVRARKFKKFLHTYHIHLIEFAHNLNAQDLMALLECIRTRTAQAPHLVQPSPRITLRTLPAPLTVDIDDASLEPEARVTRTLASAITVMELFYDALKRADMSLVTMVKRIARSLVNLAQEHPRLLVCFTGISNTSSDAPMLAIKSAILALLTARNLTHDRKNLLDIAMSALLHDAGTLRAAKLWGHAQRHGVKIPPRVSEDIRDRMPEASSMMMALFGQLNEASMARSIYSYEAHHIQRRHTRGFPYSGALMPTVEAMILATARQFLDLLSMDMAHDTRVRVDQAMETIWSHATSKLERFVIKLLAQSMGLFMRGMQVMLSGGWKGIVIANHMRPSLFARPIIRLVYDPQGKPITPFKDVDLSQPNDTIIALGRIVGSIPTHDTRLAQAQRSLLSNTPDIFGAHTREDATPEELNEKLIAQGAKDTNHRNQAPTPPNINKNKNKNKNSSSNIAQSIELDISASAISAISDRIHMVNIDDIAQFIPDVDEDERTALSAPHNLLGPNDHGLSLDSESSEPSESVDLPTSPTSISPESLDSSLVEAYSASSNSSRVALLKHSVIKQIDDSLHTTLLPRALIATLMLQDRQKHQKHQNPQNPQNPQMIEFKNFNNQDPHTKT